MEFNSPQLWFESSVCKAQGKICVFLISIPLVKSLAVYNFQHRYYLIFFQVLFVMNPNIQPVASKIHEMILRHPLALDNLAPALMNFYTGIWDIFCNFRVRILPRHPWISAVLSHDPKRRALIFPREKSMNPYPGRWVMSTSFSTDVETTGSSNEFYDKFSIRYHISIIMKSLWEDLGHRQAIMKQSRWDRQMAVLAYIMIGETCSLQK